MKYMFSYAYYILIIAGGMIVYISCRKIGRSAQRQALYQSVFKGATGQAHYYGERERFKATEELVTFKVQSEGSSSFIERKGLLSRKPGARAVVLICHGFTCTKDDVRFLRRALFPEYTTLMFDFRAHGECAEGQFCTFGESEKDDVIGAVQFIRSQPDLAGKPLIVYGFSMGAVASLLAQAKEGDLFDAAIWDCPFDSTDNVIKRLLDQLSISIAGYELSVPGKSFLQRYAYNPYVQDLIKRALQIRGVSGAEVGAIMTRMVNIDTIAEAQKINIPVLLIVCKQDIRAPVPAVANIYRKLGGYKRLLITNGRGHFDSFFHDPERYAYEVRLFISKLLNNSLHNDPQEEVAVDISSGHINDTEAYWHALVQGKGI